MDKSFWDRVQELRESINGGVQPKAEIHLPTQTIKFALGMYLFQSGVIALWWSVRDNAFFPWMIFMSAFLQVGWFWSKVTESWKYSNYNRVEHHNDIEDPDPQGMSYSDYTNDEWTSSQSHYHTPQPIHAPTINIQNAGITSNKPNLEQFQTTTQPIQHPLQQDKWFDSP